MDLGVPRAGPEPLRRVVEGQSGAFAGRFGRLPDPGFGPDPHLQGLALLVQQQPAFRRRQPLRLDHRRTVRRQVGSLQGPGFVQDPYLVEPATAG